MKTLNQALALALVLSSTAAPSAFAVKTAIDASGNVAMNAALKAYQDNVLKVVTKECLDENAKKETLVSLTVDPHGNIMRVVLSNTGLESAKIVNLINTLKALKLGDAGEGQSDTLRITFDFDLAEVLAGAKSTGTSLSIHGGQVTGDGTMSGGIRIGGGGIIASGNRGIIASGAAPGANLGVTGNILSDKARLQAEKEAALKRLADAEKVSDVRPQELCTARIGAAQALWQSEDYSKSKEIIGQALKYLEGPAGPMDFMTARNLTSLAQLMLTGTTGGDPDLVWRIYSVVEKKAANGVNPGDLMRLGRLRGQTGNFLNGDQVISVLSRLLELREMREGTNSPKLINVLNALATADQLQQKNEAAEKALKRVEAIKQANAQAAAPAPHTP